MKAARDTNAGNQVHPMAIVETGTVLGLGNVVSPYSLIGGAPQTAHHLEAGGCAVGNENRIHEYVSVHRGTNGGRTILGNENLIMAYSHIAHDACVGNNVIVGHRSTVGGHVWIDDFASIGAHASLAPGLCVGTHGYVAPGARLVRDVPPFCVNKGDRKATCVLNFRRISQLGWKRGDVRNYMAMFRRNGAGKLLDLDPETPEIALNSLNPETSAAVARYLVQKSQRTYRKPKIIRGF